MDAFVQIPLQSAPCFRLRSKQASFPSSRITFVGVRGSHNSRISSLNGSASSFEHSNQDDGPDEPPIPKQDTTQVSTLERTVLCEGFYRYFEPLLLLSLSITTCLRSPNFKSGKYGIITEMTRHAFIPRNNNIVLLRSAIYWRLDCKFFWVPRFKDQGFWDLCTRMIIRMGEKSGLWTEKRAPRMGFPLRRLCSLPKRFCLGSDERRNSGVQLKNWYRTALWVHLLFPNLLKVVEILIPSL